MSIQQLKELFGNQEAVLELVQLEGGELALRNAGSEKEPLVKIQFSDELKAILGALYTTNFTEPLSYQDSAFLKLPKFP
ncbi:hypothetical protein EJ507_10780 [Acinetobacter baumannii]|nr:hypothetical protein EJ507_10780 [Acinetobacter baumannii]